VATDRLLLIEDDERLAVMLNEYLSREGYEVSIAHTGSVGLDLYRQRSFKVVLLDLMLPDTSGLEICKQLRSYDDVPILMLTAKGDPMDRIVGLELGADDYLPKPFEPRELLARLKAILRRTDNTVFSAEKNVSTFGSLEIHHDARYVCVDGFRCDLTSYQFKLLEVLAHNAGRVQSRDYLMDQLQGMNLEVFDRSIDVHISRIRSEIESNPKNPRRVITVRGAGYVFAREQE